MVPDDEQADLVDLGETVHRARIGGLDGGRRTSTLAIAAAIAVIVAGIVFAGRPDLAIVGASPTPSGSTTAAAPTAVPDESPFPRPRPRVTVTPVPCLDDGMWPDGGIDVRTGAANYRLAPTWDAGDQPATPETWSVAAGIALAMPSENVIEVANLARLDVVAPFLDCLDAWTVSFIKLDAPGALDDLTTASSAAWPGSDRFEVVAPPPGDWAMRLVVGTGKRARWLEYVAHILVVGSTPWHGETVIEPAVPCGDAVTTADAALFVGETAYPGVAVGSSQPAAGIIDARLGQFVEIRLAGDRCALTWSVRWTSRSDAANPDPLMFEDVWPGPIGDPRVAAQNRFPYRGGIGAATWDVTGEFSLEGGETIVRAWAVSFEGFAPPILVVSRQGAAGEAHAYVGCGMSISMEGGYDTTDDCGSNLPTEPLESLVVKKGDRLTFSVDGWEVGSWSASVGRFTGDPPWYGEEAFLRSASSPPVDFPAPASPGVATLSLGGCLTRDALTVCGSWYMIVDVR